MLVVDNSKGTIRGISIISLVLIHDLIIRFNEFTNQVYGSVLPIIQTK